MYALRSKNPDSRCTVRLCCEGVIKQTHETLISSIGKARVSTTDYLVSTYMIQAVSCVACGMLKPVLNLLFETNYYKPLIFVSAQNVFVKASV